MSDRHNDTQAVGRLEQRLSRVLSWGVTLSAIMIGVGFAAYAWQHGVRAPVGNRESFDAAFVTLRGGEAIIRGVMGGDGLAIMQLGVVFLLMTPLMRVISSLVLFGVRRDWLYVVITGIVLTVLFVAMAVR